MTWNVYPVKMVWNICTSYFTGFVCIGFVESKTLFKIFNQQLGNDYVRWHEICIQEKVICIDLN